jgi:hypothetical protein
MVADFRDKSQCKTFEVMLSNRDIPWKSFDCHSGLVQYLHKDNPLTKSPIEKPKGTAICMGWRYANHQSSDNLACSGSDDLGSW